MKKMDQICYIVHETDNVATAMEDVTAGDIKLTGENKNRKGEMIALQQIPFGHKVALCDMEEGDQILKYGVCIGIATKKIRKGMHVHLHNMKSAYDFRSAQLDPVTVHAKVIEYKMY